MRLTRTWGLRQGAWAGQLKTPTSAAVTEDTPTQIALASLISSHLLSLPGAAPAAPADDRDSVTSTSTLAALCGAPAAAAAGAGQLASVQGEHAASRDRLCMVRRLFHASDQHPWHSIALRRSSHAYFTLPLLRHAPVLRTLQSTKRQEQEAASYRFHCSLLQVGGVLPSQPGEATQPTARTAMPASCSHEACAPSSLVPALERRKTSPSPQLAGMEGLLAAVQASSSGEISAADVPAALPSADVRFRAPAMQGVDPSCLLLSASPAMAS